MEECQTWDCGRPAIAQLVVRRPCGHAVALNSTGDRAHVVDGSPPALVQPQWACADCIRARAGRSAPGPSTCPECGVREPVTVDALTHAAHPLIANPLCARGLVAGESIVYDRSEPVTCPDCLEWLHA